MPSLALIPDGLVLLALALPGLAAAVYWGVALMHIVSSLRAIPPASKGLDLAGPGPNTKICVIVPAHNEALTIEPLIRSLARQTDARFVLALDRCTDETQMVAERVIAGDPRFEVITITSCPDGWAGKVNAAWTAVERSAAAREADLLVFTDADCVFHDRCLEACASLMEHRSLDLLSLLSTLSSDRWFERVAQPMATFELMRQYPLRRANRQDELQRPFANGQFMMFRSAAYRQVGGHEAVRSELLEDIAFARLMGRSGLLSGVLIADGLVRCRMYDSWKQFVTGWKRIFIESTHRKSARLIKAGWRLRLTGCVFPIASVVCSAVGGVLEGSGARAMLGVGVAGLVLWISSMVLALRAGRAPAWCAALQPIGAWLVGGILIRAGRDLASGVPTRWGGREYVLADRSKA